MHSIESFKGNPTIVLKAKADDRFGFTFGAAKARLILDHLDEIRAFVAANPPTPKGDA